MVNFESAACHHPALLDDGPETIPVAGWNKRRPASHRFEPPWMASLLGDEYFSLIRNSAAAIKSSKHLLFQFRSCFRAISLRTRRRRACLAKRRPLPVSSRAMRKALKPGLWSR